MYLFIQFIFTERLSYAIYKNGALEDIIWGNAIREYLPEYVVFRLRLECINSLVCC